MTHHATSAKRNTTRPLRVFHLPQNIASVMKYNIEGLDALGVQNRSLLMSEPPAANNTGLTYYPRWHSKLSLKRGYFEHKIFWTLVQNLIWADVVHWYFDATIYSNGLDFALAKRLCTKRVVEFLGSDLRDTLKEGQENPRLLSLTEEDLGYDIRGGTRRSHRNQERFAEAGYNFFVVPDLMDSVLPAYTDRTTIVERPIDPALFDVQKPPRQPEKKPLIVHAPTSSAIKGTPFVLETIERLRKEREFDFVLAEGMPHAELIGLLAEADIAVDQFVLGEYGVFSLEAMALGTVAVAWISERVRPYHPSDLPVVSASVEELYQALLGLLDDPARRSDIGARSKEFVRRYHTPKAVAKTLIKGYGAL